MKHIFTYLWIALFSASSLIAQEAIEEKESSEPQGRVAWFVYTSMPEGLENPVSIMSGKDITEVTLSKRSPSEPIKIPTDGILQIVRKVENPEDPDKPKYLILAKALVPEGVNKALIILVPAAENPSGLVFQPRIKDLASFTGGNSMFLNMTNLKIGVEMGKTKMQIEPGKDQIYSDPANTEPTNIPVRYSYYHPEKKKWKVLSASTIVLYPTRREICIFSWDDRFKRVDYHGITFPVM